MLVRVRKEQLQRIREFVLEVDTATRPGPAQPGQHAHLARAYHRLSADVQDMVADGYRLCLTAHERGRGHDVEAARYQVMANLIRGIGLTREQILATPATPGNQPELRAERWQPDDAPDDAIDMAEVPRVRRPDSEPGSQPVATAVPMPEAAARRPRARWSMQSSWAPRVPGRRGMRRWLALAALAAVAILGFLAWSWYATPLERLAAPEPPERELFPINRVIEFEGGAMIISHGERDGDTTWLNAFELNFGDALRPTANPAVLEADIAGRDSASERDIDVAKRVLNVSGPDAKIPPRAVRRRVIPVPTRADRDSVVIELEQAPAESLHVVPFH